MLCLYLCKTRNNQNSVNGEINQINYDMAINEAFCKNAINEINPCMLTSGKLGWEKEGNGKKNII